MEVRRRFRGPFGRRTGVITGRLATLMVVLGSLAAVLTGCSGGAAQLDLATDFPMTMYTGSAAVGGDEISFDDLRGKPIALNFWAGLCPPCRAEMPDMQDFYDENHQDILLVGIDVGPYIGLGDRNDAKALLESLGIQYPTGSTTQGSIMQDYGVLTMPTTIFITPQGQIFRKWSGPLNKGKLVELTQEMLAADAS